MKVILIQDVENLGKIGESVNVKKGYARNFLIPRKLALFATDRNMEQIETMQKQQELKNAKERSNLESLISVLNKTTLKFSLKATTSPTTMRTGGVKEDFWDFDTMSVRVPTSVLCLYVVPHCIRATGVSCARPCLINFSTITARFRAPI